MLPFGGMRLVGLKEGKKRSKRRKEKKGEEESFSVASFALASSSCETHRIVNCAINSEVILMFARPFRT